MRANPVARSWVVLMHSGVPAVDWGDGKYLDLMTMEFFTAEEKEISHRALETDLHWLKHIGRIDDYDVNYIYLSNLPNFNSLEDN
ncbi:MAG: hypothetical protein HY835_06865 [Anaerolineae bacterium]|nr:hypothetical protein [Anaerolineae bacterium]